MESSNENKWQVAEIKLMYNPVIKASDRPQVHGSEDVHRILKNSWDASTIELYEEFKVLFTNRSNRVIGILPLSRGGVAGTVADPKLIFAAAVKCAACGIVLAHNHPSGNLKPSQADIDLTKKISGGARLLDMQVLDHIILTASGYFSFADEGLL